MVLLMALLPAAAVAKDNNYISVIFDTDMGNDVDDALAIDMLYKYSDQKRVKLLAVMLSKEGQSQTEYIDILNTWYGYRHTPIGVLRNNQSPNAKRDFTYTICEMHDNNGKPLFKRTLKNYSKLLDAHILYRKILSKQPDKSVTIIATGFSTNLARLLESGGDKYSKLSGRELVSRKISRLVMMAGDMSNTNFQEFNVVSDVKAAQTVFSSWPTPIVTSPFEVGNKIRYPASSIEKDYGWAEHHPVIESYKAYMKMPYSRQTWDLTAVLYAVEGAQWFGISPNGDIKVSAEGSTTFIINPKGSRQYLTVNNEQCKQIRSRFIELITQRPKIYR